MKTQLQRIEVETVGRCDDDLAIDDALRRQPFDQRVVQLGEIAIERTEVPALDVHVALRAEHDGAEAVPFRLEQEAVAFGDRVNELGQHRLDGWRWNHGFTCSPTGSSEAVTGFATVSYTHLRAHETPEHLVCRLLLVKKR